MLTSKEITDRLYHASEINGGPGNHYWYGYLDGMRGVIEPARLSTQSYQDAYDRGIEDYRGDKELWDALTED
jgi:hypothetical protein